MNPEQILDFVGYPWWHTAVTFGGFFAVFLFVYRVVWPRILKPVVGSIYWFRQHLEKIEDRQVGAEDQRRDLANRVETIGSRVESHYQKFMDHAAEEGPERRKILDLLEEAREVLPLVKAHAEILQVHAFRHDASDARHKASEGRLGKVETDVERLKIRMPKKRSIA